jgi:superoxide reductase
MTEINAKTDIGRRGLVIGAVAAGTLAATQMAVSTARAEDAANLGLFEGINREKNPNSMTTLEKLHTPDFAAPTTVKKGESASVAVRIGAQLHPMTMNHWIERLRVFDDKHQPIADVTFARVGVTPVCEFHIPVNETTTLIAQVFCNVHGIWEARHTITV